MLIAGYALQFLQHCWVRFFSFSFFNLFVLNLLSLFFDKYIYKCRDPSKGFFCYAQGYSTHFFCVASFLWTTTIAFTLHRTVVKHKTDVEDLEAMFHLYVWGMNSCSLLYVFLILLLLLFMIIASVAVLNTFFLQFKLTVFIHTSGHSFCQWKLNFKFDFFLQELHCFWL